MLAILAVTVTAAICFLVNDFIGYQTVGLIFLILTALLSLFLGRGPVLLTALLNFMVWNFFFIPPILTFHIDNLHDIIVLFANLAVAVTGGTLINRLRKNQADLEMSKKNITLLYSLLESRITMPVRSGIWYRKSGMNSNGILCRRDPVS
jgi:two-component system sensor histidine kinase KdpD